MTKTQYLKALRMLGLTVASKETAELLGLSIRQVWRYSIGAAEIPGSVERLLKMYLKHGIPKD